MHRCDFDQTFELQSLSKTVLIVNKVKKLQNQYVHNNTGDDTHPQAIPGGTRPIAGGAHDFFRGHFIFEQLVSITVEADPPGGQMVMEYSEV